MSLEDLMVLKDQTRALGLAVVMNYPGVVTGAFAVSKQIAALSDMTKDGHAPFLSGNALNAYVTAGLRSDHECTRLSEARERIGLCMHGKN
jgi:adenine deaminase